MSQQVVELPDGGGTIYIPPTNSSDRSGPVTDSVKRNRAKRAMVSFINGFGSPFLRTNSSGDVEIAVA